MNLRLLLLIAGLIFTKPSIGRATMMTYDSEDAFNAITTMSYLRFPQLPYNTTTQYAPVPSPYNVLGMTFTSSNLGFFYDGDYMTPGCYLAADSGTIGLTMNGTRAVGVAFGTYWSGPATVDIYVNGVATAVVNLTNANNNWNYEGFFGVTSDVPITSLEFVSDNQGEFDILRVERASDTGNTILLLGAACTSLLVLKAKLTQIEKFGR